MKIIPVIIRYLRPYWPLGIITLVLIVLSSLIGLLAPWPLKFLIDNVLEQHPLPPFLENLFGSVEQSRFSLLIFAVVAGLAVSFASDGLSVLNKYITTKLEQRMILDFRSDLFQHAQRLSLTFHDQRRTGDFMARINFMSGAVGEVPMMIPPLAQSLFTLVGMFWITFSIDRQLALLSLVVMPFLFYSTRYYMTRIGNRVMQVKGLEGQSLSIVHEAMSMLRVIVAFGREKYEYQRFRKQGEQAVDARVKLTVQQTIFSLAVNLTTAVGTALVLGFGAYRVMQAKLTVGQLLIVMSYIASVYAPLEAISATLSSLQEKFISLRMALELLESKPEIEDAPDAIDLEKAEGRITFEGVHFSYQGRNDTLKDLTFDVRAGQSVALVGPTGAGKTTTISMIPRFYDPKQGRILLDGIDLRQLSLKSLRKQISLVLQEPLLFSGSIADNIRYGRLEATDEEVIEAAKAANAHDFISRLPQQYETQLGERGSQLSGGERQRICVARAFLKDAPILVLDEPTSSIDSKTEAVILEALERLMEGRTTFVVAHRLSTIRNVDLIIVLDHGAIVEYGTHEELLQNGKLYKHLYEVQMARSARKQQMVMEAVGAD